MIVRHHCLVLRNRLKTAGLSCYLSVVVEQGLVILRLACAEQIVGPGLAERSVPSGLGISHGLERAGRLRVLLVID